MYHCDQYFADDEFTDCDIFTDCDYADHHDGGDAEEQPKLIGGVDLSITIHDRFRAIELRDQARVAYAADPSATNEGVLHRTEYLDLSASIVKARRLCGIAEGRTDLWPFLPTDGGG